MMSTPTLTLLLAVPLLLIVVIFLFVRGAAKARRSAQSPPVSTGPKRHFLVGKGGDLDGQSWHIGSRRVTVGRAPSNYVQINSPDVSRIAAQLDVKDDVVKVIDMNSGAGTQVNGDGVQMSELRDGDELKIGGQTFIYHVDGDFKENAAFGAKAVGKAVAAATMDATGNLRLQAHEEYARHKGDENAAAEAVGIEVDELRRLLDH